jgi:hypothetical protein
MNLYLCLAIAAIATTITKSVLFKPLREFLGWRVLKCPYCLIHWLAISVVLFTPPVNNVFDINVFDIIINVFATVAVASLFSWPLVEYLRRLDDV